MAEVTKTSPKDVFLHLLSILWLYVAIVSFGVLVFQIIDINFPDRLNDYYYNYASDVLKWPLSILVVVFPLFVSFSYYVQKDVVNNPEKRDLKIRKWLIYLTLSIATVVISVDLISLIYTYLSGEITTRFLLKVLTVFAIAASVFTYYIWYLKNDTMAIKNPKMKIFIYGAVLVVVGFIVAGFIMAGSPQSARLRRFDYKRVNDLQNIQHQIVNYYQAKENLPESLDVLKDSISGFVPPNDPENNAPYEYTITGELSFKLCATFNTINQTSNESLSRPIPVYDPYGYNDNWEHDKGRICFDRSIDPDIYPPFTNQAAPIKR